jgi:DNA-binding IclR family transcriptional regulator
MLTTLNRAGVVLDLFTSDRPEWGATAISRELGVPKSIVHDILVSLASIGFLQRTPTGRYRLGWRLVSLASVAVGTSDLLTHTIEVLADLGCGETRVSLYIWDRDRLVRMEANSASARFRRDAPVPSWLVRIDDRPAALALLATRSRRSVRDLWCAGALVVPHASFEALCVDLDGIDRDGYASGAEDRSDDCSVAVAIRDEVGLGIAAISLEAVAARSAWRYAPLLTRAARRIAAAVRDEASLEPAMPVAS